MRQGICKRCGKNFEFTASRQCFCSKDCKNSFYEDKFMGKPNTACDICGKPYRLKPSHLAKIKVTCCSKKCSAIYRQRLMSGEGNHQYGLIGELNASFRADWNFTTFGYIYLRFYNHPFKSKNKLIFAHRLIMEEYLRVNSPDNPNLVSVPNFPIKFLKPEIHIHHINENKLDNRISNLLCLTKSEHQALHSKQMQLERNKKGQFMKRGRKKSENKKQLYKKRFSDAGLDVASNEDIIIPAGESRVVHTGLYLAIPEGHVGLLWSRSGLSVKNKIEVGAGCLDVEYRGEVLVHLYNLGDEDFTIHNGDRIAQLLTIPVNLETYEDVEELEETDRNSQGFGSTGIF